MARNIWGEQWLGYLLTNIFRPRYSGYLGLFFGIDHILLLFPIVTGVLAYFPQLRYQLDVRYVDFMRPRTENQVAGILIARIWSL